MLDKAKEHVSEYSVAPDARDGRPQTDLLYQYLMRLREAAGDPRAEIASASVLK